MDKRLTPQNALGWARIVDTHDGRLSPMDQQGLAAFLRGVADHLSQVGRAREGLREWLGVSDPPDIGP